MYRTSCVFYMQHGEYHAAFRLNDDDNLFAKTTQPHQKRRIELKYVI